MKVEPGRASPLFERVVQSAYHDPEMHAALEDALSLLTPPQQQKVRGALKSSAQRLGLKRGFEIHYAGDQQEGNAYVISTENAMKLAWNRGHLESIELCSTLREVDADFRRANQAELEFLATLLVRYRKAGGAFPEGTEAFADAFNNLPI